MYVTSISKLLKKKKKAFEVRLIFYLCSGALGPVLTCAVLSLLELSLSAGSLQLEGKRREFTSSGSRKLYFDTHALVCLLEENGNPLSLVTWSQRKTLYIMPAPPPF